MSNVTDMGMAKTMALVMGALCLFTLSIAFLARGVGDNYEDPTDKLLAQARAKRIAPIGASYTAEEAEAAGLMDAGGAPADAAQGATLEMDGETLAMGACAACHTAGVGGAPKFGDDAAWAPRRELGFDGLLASVINGKGSMPAGGASTYNEAQLRAAVAWMSGVADPDADAATAEQAAPAPEAEASTEGEAEAVNEAAAQDGSAAEETAVEATAAAAGPSDRVKGIVDGVCMACHISGVAGAPKIGDAAAWGEREAQGMDVMAQHVINGLNAMPPRGGSDLSDDEVPAAIQYLMSK